MTLASSGGFGTRTRPETIATEIAVDNARAIGLLWLISSKVPKGETKTPLRVSRDSRIVLKWGSVHRFGDIVLYDPEWWKSACFTGWHRICYRDSSHGCPEDWPVEKTRADLALATAENAFSVVDLGMSFIIY
jgi:hypothetical protein